MLDVSTRNPMPTTKETRIMMCAPYIRARDAAAAIAQRDLVRRFIEKRLADGWIPSLPAYEDIGYSGFARAPGPALRRLMRDAESRQIDIVVIAQPNRLSRRFQVLFEVFEKLETNGVRLYSATQGRPLDEIVTRERMQRTAKFFSALERDYESSNR
jgi:DNA invertase Pin-like site-specific DNA recombinase